MVFCIVGLVVFGFLGIFSAKYRTYFKEAVHCMKRQITLKPCDTKFDEKMKSKISGKLMKVSPAAARFTYKRFALISWIFLIAMIVSFAFMAEGFYNLAVYGTCDPHEGNCIFNPGYTIHNVSCGTEVCECDAVACGTNNATLCDVNCSCLPR